METYYEKICEKTFSGHHNPNCASPFQVRLIGPRGARLDNMQDATSRDICGYGKTLEEAAKNAWQTKHSN